MKGARSSRPSRPLCGFSGFTLLELAVAAALGAILLAAVAAVSIRGITAWRDSDSRLRQLVEVEKGLARLSEELRNGVALADLPFEGTKGEVVFATAEEPHQLAQVRYRLAPGASAGGMLTREWQPFPNERELPAQTSRLVSGVTQFTLQYGAVAEVDGRKMLSWLEDWGVQPQEPKPIPRMVRVRLESVDARGRAVSVTRDLWIPNGTWGSLPGE